jgi:hypothetical protein
LAAEYRTVLPDEKLLAEELARTRRQVGVRPPQEMPHGHDPLLLPNGFSSIKLQSVSSGVAHFGQPGYETDLLYVAGLLALVLGGSGPFTLAKRANTSR